MRQLWLLAVLFVLFPLHAEGQSVEPSPAEDNVALQKQWLLSDLQLLNERSDKLGRALARASAKAEIADAAWVLDQSWAKKLLTEAYELTFPEEQERAKLKRRRVGDPPATPTALDRARRRVRSRVLSVARRDAAFASQLMQQVAEQLGVYEGHVQYADLAVSALEAGDKEEAGRYILRSIDSDPTHLNATHAILKLAALDRAAADELILRYFERLRATPVALSRQAAMRTHFILYCLIYPSGLELFPGSRQVAPPGPAVMRAYVSYMVEALAQAEQVWPGSLNRSRGILMTVWVPLKQYAPELTGAFLALERQSRTAGGDSPLPQVGFLEQAKEEAEKRLLKESDGEHPDPSVIGRLIASEDFVKARKLIDKLDDGPQKSQLAERADAKEALTLAARGDIPGARLLAERLNRAVSILEVYSSLLSQCARHKDQQCAATLVYQASKQLKRADATPPPLPAGIPFSTAVDSREFDPVLSSLSRLARLVAPLDETLALEILDETVAVANRSEMDTGNGGTGLEVDAFRSLASKNETRVRQAAETLKDPLRQVIALAAIYQGKAQKLELMLYGKKKEARP